MKKLFLLSLLLPLFLLWSLAAQAQERVTFPINGTADPREGVYCFTNATIFVSYNKKIDQASLLIRNGMVQQVGTNIMPPKDAVVIDLQGKTIYPAFIDIYTEYGLPEQKENRSRRDGRPQMLSDKKGAFGWNEAIHPETNAHEQFSPDDKSAKTWRDLGFASVLTHKKDGIARGTSALVLLGDQKAQEMLLRTHCTAQYAFDKGSSTQDYPSSLMGSIALLRQTYLDAQWYQNSQKTAEYNLSLEAWNNLQKLPQIFDGGDRLSLLRADKVGDEFGIQYILKTKNDVYQRIDDIKATQAALIVPLTLPAAYDVENPFEADNVALSDMMHWELAPTNLATIEKAGISFALTTADLKNPSGDFYKNLRTAIERGLSKEAALKALTLTPATLIGMQQQLGSLDNGKMANFIITSGDIFDEKNTLFETWIKGKRYTVNPMQVVDLRGNYTFSVDKNNYDLRIKGDTPYDTNAEIWTITAKDTTKIPVKLQIADKNLSISFNPNPKDTVSQNKIIRLTGWTNPDGKQWNGTGQNPDGKWINWQATRTSQYVAEKKTDKKDDKTEAYGSVKYPFNGYGWTTVPSAEAVLFQNATVWTNEKDGILQNTDVLIQNGKITQIGKNISVPKGTKSIDATGKHLTAGIIDEHSHIAISAGVNEGTQSCSSEVRIGDVVDSEDIDIYRQLAGGVTSSHLLHGSANAIGGQTSLIKLRWGLAPEKMKYPANDPFIKFALGENVKQANWGDEQVIRFPQTRMGVEQVYIDHFTQALQYDAAIKNNASAKKGSSAIRRNLELEALAEIINKKRFITCHSYVQSEIAMLMRVAERFGFKINTFTHILEGYKLADRMKEHGANASSFSDWWAYKYEVYEAIPHNGAILHNLGVNVAFNSDDAEMARRLNQEAAKAVKYGGVSEEEAWKFVTLNPAKMLHIDQNVGSLKIGKDADVVLWSDNPLSIYAKAERTYVDGICYYDITNDQALRQSIQQERNRLIQKMLLAKQGGAATQEPMSPKRRHYHCNDKGSYQTTDFYDTQDHSEDH
ncbi:MAG: amidohydrolase family protein [Chitinophagales bacterium]|jgi:imidazolonepropionase-like amidohydrolase|nr:amidohydrolase family protein [Chitinophagales bacterium]HNI43328.1 amidohydrolase family protein [Chitinophagales bacterium]